MKFDGVEFYHANTPEIFDEAISWAETIIHIEEDQLEILKHVRISYLIMDTLAWKKKNNRNFEVGIGSYDRAELSVTIEAIFKCTDFLDIQLNLTERILSEKNASFSQNKKKFQILFFLHSCKDID